MLVFAILDQILVMVCVDIAGIDVDFPFEPYECQKKYMEKVILCLQKVSLFFFYLFIPPKY